VNNLRFRPRVPLALLLPSAALCLLAACGDDADPVVTSLEILIHGPDDNRPGGSCEAAGAVCGFPASVLAAAQGGAVVVTVFEGEKAIANSVTRFDRYRVEMPPVTFGPNRWVSVELIDQLGFTATTRVLAAGATQRFEARPDGTTPSQRVYTTSTATFTPAFYFDEFEEQSVRSNFDLPGGRAAFGQAVLDDSGVVVVVGGASVSADGAGIELSGFLDTIEVYDPRYGRWLAVTQPGCDVFALGPSECALRLPQAGAFLTATAVSATQVVIVGGMNDSDGFLATTDQALLLDFTLIDEFTAEATLTPLARTGLGPGVSERAMHTATRLSDGSVIVAGGFRSAYANPTLLGNVDVIRVTGASGSYEPTGSTLANPRLLHTATHIEDGGHGVLITGGRTANALVSASEVIYLSDTGDLAFDLVPEVPGSTDLGTARFGHVAVPYRCLDDPTTYVAFIGGYTATGSTLLEGTAPTDLVEIYDPTGILGRAAYEFIRDPQLKLSTGRAYPLAAPLRASGGLVIGGGIGADGAVSSAERLLNRDTSDCAVFTRTTEAFVAPVPGGMGGARAMGGAAAYPSHLVHFFGGTAGTGALNTGIYFNPGDYDLY
jgi:hypothetical protein